MMYILQAPQTYNLRKILNVSLEKQASFLQDILDISQPDFPQFTASTPQVVIFNQTLKGIQNGLAITMLSLNKPCQQTCVCLLRMWQ